MKHFHFVTLFPETIEVWLRTSIIGRAHKEGLFGFSTYQLRDFSENKHKTVDDAAYGGGGGMVLKLEPLVKVTEEITTKFGKENCRVIYFSPAGKRLKAQHLPGLSHSRTEHFILICGHYEGVDERFIENWVDEEISIGDFVVSGGELPALLFSDALIRQFEGTVSHERGAQTESFSIQDGNATLLEYPHYTRPPVFRNLSVPSVLLNGNHQEIERWRLEKARSRTETRRSDLLNS